MKKIAFFYPGIIEKPGKTTIALALGSYLYHYQGLPVELIDCGEGNNSLSKIHAKCELKYSQEASFRMNCDKYGRKPVLKPFKSELADTPTLLNYFNEVNPDTIVIIDTKGEINDSVLKYLLQMDYIIIPSKSTASHLRFAALTGYHLEMNKDKSKKYSVVINKTNESSKAEVEDYKLEMDSLDLKKKIIPQYIPENISIKNTEDVANTFFCQENMHPDLLNVIQLLTTKIISL
jgi:MinD-like ATPase involved in chromosome partitioning or flagellar assembly